MSQPTPGDVFVSKPLTNISLAYWQADGDFIADKMFLNVPSEQQAGIVWEWDREFFLRNEMKLRAPNTPTAGVGAKLNQIGYSLGIVGLHHDISDQRRANEASPIQGDRAATLLLTQQAKQFREIQLSTRAFTAGKWGTTDQTGVSGVPAANQFKQWNDAASTPIKDINDRRDAIKLLTGVRPNVLGIGMPVWNALKTNPDILDRLKYGQTAGQAAQVTKSAVAQLFELDEILVSDVTQATHKEGAAFASQFVIGKVGCLFYRPPMADIEIPAAGYTMTWKGYMGATGYGVRMKKFRMEMNAADRIEIEQSFEPKLLGTLLGQFLASMVA